MTIRDTSLEALMELERSGKAESRRAQVLKTLLHATGPLSRREIAKRTGLELCTVTGRVNELLKAKQIAETAELVTCSLSGKHVHGVVTVGRAPEQRELWAA